MLDFGWTELLVIAALGVLVLGPKELPVIMRSLGNLVRRLSYIKYAFTSQFEDFMREQDLDDMRHAVNFETKRRSDEFDEAAEDEAYMTALPVVEENSDESPQEEEKPS